MVPLFLFAVVLLAGHAQLNECRVLAPPARRGRRSSSASPGFASSTAAAFRSLLCPQSHGDPGQAQAAQLLEEGWAWGFDVDAWRAHLNVLTWPEVARQLAIAAGLGRWAGCRPSLLLLLPLLPALLAISGLLRGPLRHTPKPKQPCNRQRNFACQPSAHTCAHLGLIQHPLPFHLPLSPCQSRKRPKPKKEEKPKLGQEGEDIVVDEQGGLKLKLPPRLAVGSVKAAAWQVGGWSSGATALWGWKVYQRVWYV